MDHALAIHPTRFGRLEESGTPLIMADHATLFFLEHLVFTPGDRVAEPGCGTGVLSLFAALSGASTVHGTDLDETSLAYARLNAKHNGFTNVQFSQGHLLEPVSEPIDVIMALLPHKPAPAAFNPRYYGGSDGTDLLLETIRQAESKLRTGGRLYLYHNSIAHPKRVENRLAQTFSTRCLAEKKRYFTREEFDRLVPGMFAHLESQKRKGEAEFAQDEKGLYFVARILEGRRS